MKYKLFSALCLMICLVPIVGLLIWGPSGAAANETLSAAPSLTGSDGSFNTEVLDEVTDYVGDHFALRQEMITAWRTVVAGVFHESDEEDVILGKDGWLFYAETLDDYEGVDLMTDRQVYAAARSLALLQEACEAEGAQFLFTIAPNKNSLYPEYMPDRYPAATSESDRERLAAALAAEGVAYLDLYSLLDAEDAILYRQLDSHWTNAGAALAADALLAALGVEAENWYGTGSTEVEAEVGDLYEMLYPTGTARDTDVAYAREFTFTYASAIRSAEDNRISTVCDGADGGSLLMFRDSFGNALYPFVAEGFESALFSRANPYDLTLLESTGADTVVVELVERNLTWLTTRPGIFAAPERTLDETVTISESVTATATLAENGPEGCVELTGAVAADGMDDESPIYLRLGDTLYEATPAGDGETPFTAYVPADAAAEALTVLVQVNGQWVESLPVEIAAS